MDGRPDPASLPCANTTGTEAGGPAIRTGCTYRPRMRDPKSCVSVFDTTVTEQIADTIIVRGEEYRLASEPLEHCWPRLGRERPNFITPHSACWRGYVASWEIVDGKPFLRGIEATLAPPGTTFLDNPEDGWAATLQEIFPGEAIPVFAGWFTGTLRVREGELLEYVHMPYESVYERTRRIDVVDGLVTGERLDEPSPRELRRQRMEELLQKVKERQS